MLRISSKGNFNNFREFADRVLKRNIYADLDRFGQMGVDALAGVTPIRSGRAAASWRYRIIRSSKHVGIEWYSTDEIRGITPVVILLQYGHATGTGGYVRGRDFINPAMRPIFDQIANDVWTKVTA